METLDVIQESNWEVLLSFFPQGWEEKAYELKAMTRRRKIKEPQALMRILLIHLVGKFSLRTSVVKAEESGICSINATDLFNRLKLSWEWLRWNAQAIYKSLRFSGDLTRYTRRFRIRAVDSTTISKPGSNGSDWRIHYSVNLHNLRCEDFEVTDAKGGEGLRWYEIRKDDLMVGDRNYCRRKEIFHALQYGGDVIFRFHSCLPIKTFRGRSYPILKKLKDIKEGDIGDWNVYLKDDNGERIKGRLIGIRKSSEAAEREKERILKDCRKKKKKPRQRTLELAKYTVLYTTVNRHRLKSIDVMNIYRVRWQIELCFKRMKSILGLGQLPKKDPDSSRAWLNGKLLVAMLIEKIHWELEFFSPWGYPLQER